MKSVWALGALLICLAGPASAGDPVIPNPDHESMLASTDPKLAANKRLVYDWTREVFEAGRIDLASKYMAEGYIQHNPNAPSGLEGFKQYLAKRRRPGAIEPRVKHPLVAIVAEGDLVMTAFAVELPEPGDESKKYTTTWFDLFRIQDGKIVEHWDGAMKRPPGAPPAPPPSAPGAPSAPNPPSAPSAPKL